MLAKVGDTVVCLEPAHAEGYLEQYKEYIVVQLEGVDYKLQGVSGVWYMGRFAVRQKPASEPPIASCHDQSSHIDQEENRLRAALTCVSDPHSCRKCGAPLPCAYH